MKNLNKVIAIICLTAVMICIGYRIKARADDITQAPVTLQTSGNAYLTAIADAYSSLTSEQKTIAAYLIGAFNNVYLMARGFSYSIPDTETAWKAQFIALGEKIWQFATTEYGWKSRFNETFRQYLSSVLVYASGINSSFDTWYTANTGTGELYIPYSADAFSAWTEFYNDPTGDGISTFGSITSEWVSGNEYDFAFSGLPWRSSSDADFYNNFILNKSPVLFTNDVFRYDRRIQCALSFSNIRVVDALFLKRNDYQFFRYGYSDFTLPNTSRNFEVMGLNFFTNYDNRVTAYEESLTIQWNGIISADTPFTNYSDLISYAFNKTPFYIGMSLGFQFFYPFVSHVYLVDDLNSLSNPEEIFNNETLNIVAPDPTREHFIIAPNHRMLFPSRPVGYDDPLGFWDRVIDHSVDEDGNPATDDDFNHGIINNTTINNYYVNNDDKINVPVEWFENDLSDQLANDSIPFLAFAKDCIDSLGDLQIYLYGALVFGLGGGILKKFLL